MSNNEKVENRKLDFVTMEHDILRLWEDEDYFEKLQNKNRNNLIFRFLDGPITANNPMGVHHAWGRTTKDIFLRYKAMNGYSCHYRNGFDTQGLWVEVEVEKELGFAAKNDIVKYGLNNFTNKCIERIKKYSGIITKQSKRLGQWMDWDNSYYTHMDNNIEGIWYFLKKCHEKGWIVQYDRPMAWCPRCGTSLSAHEMSGSYKQVTHKSVFFRLPVLGKNYDMLVWTTTPWTLAANVALAVNPQIDYCMVEISENNRLLVLAKESLGVLKDSNKKIVKIIKGSDLLGMEYETCFPNMEQQRNIQHKIVPWEDVDAGEGTGIVHIAPGCGEEDYELGKKLGLSHIQPVNETGIFLDGFDFLTGKSIKDTNELIFDKLACDDKLFEVMEYEHSYPICWRCKSEVIYRLVKEWYIKSDEVRSKLIEAAKNVKWTPEHMEKRMVDWLSNMSDWNISRKRFYGLPLPFYVCNNCGKLTVIGSKEELMERSCRKVQLPELHRPWIDDVKIVCPQCGEEVTRVPDVGDVWLDAGIVPFTTLGYFENREKWKKYFPVEWVTEMREQIRLWFYSMLYMGVVLEGRAPYEKVLAYNMVVAEDGTRFSKTGYMIKFDEAAEEIGSDGIRYLFAGTSVNNEVRFGYNSGNEAKRKLLNLYNVYTFFNMYASIDKPDISMDTVSFSSLEDMDRWLLSRTQEFIKTCTEAYNDYDTVLITKTYEKFIDEVSNWYIRVNRRRFWKADNDDSKLNAYKCLYFALKTVVKIMAPVVPFLTEFIWQSCVRKMERDAEESVHLSAWPVYDSNLHIEEIINEVDIARKVINLVLRLRNEKQIKVRQPLEKIYVLENDKYVAAVKKYEKVVLGETNVKKIVFVNDINELQEEYITLNFRKAGSRLGKDLPKVKKLLDKVESNDMMELVSQYDKKEEISLKGYNGNLPVEYFNKQSKAKDNVLTAREEEVVVGLSAVISDELRREGYVRDIIRHFQVFRKELDYSLEQKVDVAIFTDDVQVNRAIDEYKDYIISELLVNRLSNCLVEGMCSREILLDSRKVRIMIKKC